MNRFIRQKPNLWKKALFSGGIIVGNQIRKNLNTPSPGKKYPGVVSGQLLGSVTEVVRGSGMNTVVRIGPNKVYAAIHEFGGIINVTDKMRRFLHATGIIHLKATTTVIKIPKRPYVMPAWKQSRRKAMATIQRIIMAPIREAR